MKISIKLYSIMAATSVLILSGCSKPSADEYPNPRPGTETDNNNTNSDISSIYSFNKNEGFLNSHASEYLSSSVEMDFRSYKILTEPTISPVYPCYPRIKKLNDGTYLFIYQQGNIGSNVYYAKSSNLSFWQERETPLFAKMDMNQYNSNVSDKACFSSADAIVLDNGDILAFAAFRLLNGYTTNPLNNGIMMRRSSDNGYTWSEPQVIYRGVTWEPSALQLSSKEIHVYFTDSNVTTGNSGTSLLRSTDRGVTWTSVGKVIRQNAGEATDGSGTRIYTDQMPVAIQLNGSQEIAVAFESRFGRTGTSSDVYHVGLAYCKDNWKSGAVQGEDDGPSDKQPNLFKNQAAPYIRQFHSGETLLTDNISGIFNIRIGDEKARSFGNPNPIFKERGFWGSIEIVDNHSFLATYPIVTSTTTGGTTTSSSKLQLARFILNHRINATKLTPEIVGSNEGWKSVDDALFIGSVSQAQATFRFAYDDNNVYCIIERQDGNLSAQDGIDIYLESGDLTGDPVNLTFTPNKTNNSIECNNNEVKLASSIIGSFDDVENDKGYLIVFSIPRKSLNIAQDKIMFNAILHDTDGDDTFTGLTKTNFDKWLPIVFKDDVEPEPEPEPGEGDNVTGPKWEDTDKTNPWE